MPPLAEQDIARVRSFNRLVTRQAGAVQDRYVGRLPLGEARVLFEIGEDGATPRDIRARLALDSGYVARMIGSLKRRGLVTEKPDPQDGRTKRLLRTAAGRKQMREIDRAADELAASALEPLTPEQRERLLRAQDEVRRLLAVSMIRIELADPASADARWCLGHYYAELAVRFENSWDAGRSWPSHAADMTRPRGAFLVARFEGQPAGCGGLKTLEPGVGEIVRMWIDPAHRGLGLGARMLDALEEQARELGHTTIRLDTNKALLEAQAMYRSRGYRDVPRYSGNPYATHWFEKKLT